MRKQQGADFSAGQLGEDNEQKTLGQISGHHVWAGEQHMNSLFEHSAKVPSLHCLRSTAMGSVNAHIYIWAVT